MATSKDTENIVIRSIDVNRRNYKPQSGHLLARISERTMYPDIGRLQQSFKSCNVSEGDLRFCIAFGQDYFKDENGKTILLKHCTVKPLLSQHRSPGGLGVGMNAIPLTTLSHMLTKSASSMHQGTTGLYSTVSRQAS